MDRDFSINTTYNIQLVLSYIHQSQDPKCDDDKLSPNSVYILPLPIPVHNVQRKRTPDLETDWIHLNKTAPCILPRTKQMAGVSFKLPTPRLKFSMQEMLCSDLSWLPPLW
jgi:hypothetical protein